MPLIKNIFAALSALLLSLPAYAKTSCPEHFFGGQEPAIVTAKLAEKTKPICYESYGLMHSGVTRSALWSAEHLTREVLDDAKNLPRENNFHPDEHLSYGERAELSDYAHNGFADRGHLSPNGDQHTKSAQYETFSLANMIPQESSNNRHAWAATESATRTLAKHEGELYVVTGPVYLGDRLRRVGNVLVPTHIFKAIYSPKQRGAAAYFIENKADVQPVIVSIAQLQRITGLDVFPALPANIKSEAMDLPAPRKRARRQHSNSSDKPYYSRHSSIRDFFR